MKFLMKKVAPLLSLILALALLSSCADDRLDRAHNSRSRG